MLPLDQKTGPTSTRIPALDIHNVMSSKVYCTLIPSKGNVLSGMACCCCIVLLLCCPDPPPQPECTRDPDCPVDLACISEHCLDPCSAKTCGKNAACSVTRHTAVCTCLSGFIGDPASVCRERKPESMISLLEGNDGGPHSLAIVQICVTI